MLQCVHKPEHSACHTCTDCHPVNWQILDKFWRAKTNFRSAKWLLLCKCDSKVAFFFLTLWQIIVFWQSYSWIFLMLFKRFYNKAEFLQEIKPFWERLFFFFLKKDHKFVLFKIYIFLTINFKLSISMDENPQGSYQFLKKNINSFFKACI